MRYSRYVLLTFVAVLTLPACQPDLRHDLEPVPQLQNTSQEALAMLGRIRAEGAKNVLNELWDKHVDFEKVCAGIATGDRQWLEVARRLRAVSDAGASLSLVFSVARALSNAPAETLALLEMESDRASVFTVEDVCSVPFIEPTDRQVRDYTARTEQVLSRPLTPVLEKRRQACLKRIRQVRAGLAR